MYTLANFESSELTMNHLWILQSTHHLMHSRATKVGHSWNKFKQLPPAKITDQQSIFKLNSSLNFAPLPLILTYIWSTSTSVPPIHQRPHHRNENFLNFRNSAQLTNVPWKSQNSDSANPNIKCRMSAVLSFPCTINHYTVNIVAAMTEGNTELFAAYLESKYLLLSALWKQ